MLDWPNTPNSNFSSTVVFKRPRLDVSCVPCMNLLMAWDPVSKPAWISHLNTLLFPCVLRVFRVTILQPPVKPLPLSPHPYSFDQATPRSATRPGAKPWRLISSRKASLPRGGCATVSAVMILAPPSERWRRVFEGTEGGFGWKGSSKDQCTSEDGFTKGKHTI